MRCESSCRAPETSAPPHLSASCWRSSSTRSFRPLQGFIFDAAPFVSGEHLAIESGILTQDGVGNQLAARMPEADMLLRVEMASHHKEIKRQLADVGVTPVTRQGARLHQQIIHLQQVALILVEA